MYVQMMLVLYLIDLHTATGISFNFGNCFVNGGGLLIPFTKQLGFLFWIFNTEFEEIAKFEEIANC